MLNLIGLGLGDEKDITIKGLEAIQSSSKVFLECYTSILGVSSSDLSKFFGKEVVDLFREGVEEGIDEILAELEKEKSLKYSLLIVGDPFCATTHSDLYLRALKLGIKINVIHNASIMNAIGCTGLQLYRFGSTVSIPFWTDKWRPTSFMNGVKENYTRNLHTLCLLDIRVKELTEEALLRGKKDYEPARFMDTRTAVSQIISCITEDPDSPLKPDAIAVGVARVGQDSQAIVASKLKDFLDLDLGPPLHSLIIVAPDIHELELEMLVHFGLKK